MMNYNQMSADLGMYNGYMPPPSAYGGNQKYMPNQYPHQQPTGQHQQQPLILNQQQQQQHPVMLNQQQQSLMQNHWQHQYNTDPYNISHGSGHPNKQNAMPIQAQAHDQQSAHHMQAWLNSQSKILPMSPLSPNDCSANPLPRSSPHHNVQHMMVMSQRRSSNVSPMTQQQPAHPPPLSPIQRVTPQSAQMSPRLQQYSQTPPAPEARAVNHVRRLSASSEFISQQSLNTSSPSQSLSGHYAPGKIPSHQTHSMHNPTGPIAQQAHQGSFHTPALQSDPSHLQQCSRPSPYPARGHSVNHMVRQDTLSHAQPSQNNLYPAQPSQSNVYPSAQSMTYMNQMEQVGGRPETQQGNRQSFLSNNGPARQKEMCPDNILNAGPSPTTVRRPPSGEYHGPKTASVNDPYMSTGSRNNVPSHPFSTAVISNNRTGSGEQDISSFHHRTQVAMHTSGSDQPDNRSWAGFQANVPPASHKKPSAGRGSRGGRGTAASRARGRGATRGRGRGRADASLEKNSPQQTVPWSLPSNSSASSFHSDIEAMQAGFMAEETSSFQSSHPVEKLKETQPSIGQPVTSPTSLKFTNQTSAIATTTNSSSVISSSRAAALEAIRVKQEAVESIGKAKTVTPVPHQLEQQSKEGTSRPSFTNKPQTVNSKTNCETVAGGQPSSNSHSKDSNLQRVNFLSSPQSQSTQALGLQSTNLLRGKEQAFDSSSCSGSAGKGTHDSLAVLLDLSTSVEKKIPPAKRVDSVSNQAEKALQVHRQNSVPLTKSPHASIGKASLQRSVSNVTKSSLKTSSNSVGRQLVRQNAPTEPTSVKYQSVRGENKRPMTAKERVISMWRDGQVVGRNPTLLKRSAKVDDKSQSALQTGQLPSKSPQKTCTSETGIAHAHVPSPKRSKQVPKDESSKSKLDLYYIMFHGHKLICLNSAREKMLLLCQFQFECFPDKGMGSVNNCIDRSLRIKKKPLLHRLQSDIVSYLKKNDYKIDSEVLTINLEDARRVYHHMYNIRNCVSVSCVVTLLDQPVNLSHVIPGSKKRTFPREILGRIKTEVTSVDTDLEGNQPNPEGPNAQTAGHGESAAALGPHRTGDVRDEDARSDCTVAYGAEKAADKDDDDDIVIISVEENPNMLRYNSEGPKIGMLCNSLMGSVRSYMHNNEHYLVIEDLCKIFGSSDFNSLLDNQSISVYSCCPEIGAFLNQISDKFPPVSSFLECLVKEKDIGVQWANDQSGSDISTSASLERPSLKQEIVEEQSSCSPSKQPKLSVPTAEKNSSESELASSEPALQIDLGDSPSCNKEVALVQDSTSSIDVTQSASSKGKTDKLNTGQTGTEPSVSASPESHSSAETLASTTILAVVSKANEDDPQRETTIMGSTSCKDSLKEKEKNAPEVNASSSDCNLAQRGSENGRASMCLVSSSENSLTSSQQDQNTSSTVTDSSLLAESSFENGNKTKTYTELCQMNKTLVGIVHQLRKELAAVKQELAETKTAKEKAERVAKHLEDALATMTSSFPLGNSSAPIVIDEDELRS